MVLTGFIRKHKALAAVAVICLGIAAWNMSASIRGRIHAHFDVALGHYKILGYGSPTPWRREYVRLLKERYGVEFHEEALCIVSTSLVDYVDAYDEVSEAAANRKFGRNIFEETAEDARKTWEHRAGRGPEK
jgi:hypothetical protein